MALNPYAWYFESEHVKLLKVIHGKFLFFLPDKAHYFFVLIKNLQESYLQHIQWQYSNIDFLKNNLQV